MCDPVSLGIASFALGAAQSVMGFVGASQDAKAEREAAVRENAQTQNQLSLRQVQEQEAAARSNQSQNLEEAQAAADAEASAAVGGVSGLSLSSVLQDVRRRAANNRQATSENVKMTVAQLSLDKKGSANRAQSRINAARPPNPFTLVAGIGSAALGGFNEYNNAKNLRMQ